MTLSSLGEFGLIRHLSRDLQTRGGVRLGIGDDASVLDALQTPVVTCDCLVEGVHFRRDWTGAFSLGRKALNVNLSDIAAMGGTPVAAFVSLALGPNVELAWVEELYRGLEDAAQEANCTLAGGDTAKSKSGTFLSVTLVGDAPAPVLRSGAREGDVLLVTGTLGDAAAGLELLLRELKPSTADEEFVLRRHFDPSPRLREINVALQVRSANGERAVRAALDLSDGLAGDARHIAERSGLSLEIETARLPLSPQMRSVAQTLNVDPRAWALSGGEDYELLLCVAPDAAQAVAQNVTAATGIPVAAMGRCVPRQTDAVTLVHPDGARHAARGAWEHF